MKKIKDAVDFADCCSLDFVVQVWTITMRGGEKI